MIVKAKAPTKVIFLITLVIYSTVSSPGLTPGINPPFLFKLSANSSGFNCINV